MKQILIAGPVDDLEDVLKIAQMKGRKLLNVDKVRVKPEVTELNGDYIVCVKTLQCRRKD